VATLSFYRFATQVADEVELRPLGAAMIVGRRTFPDNHRTSAMRHESMFEVAGIGVRRRLRSAMARLDRRTPIPGTNGTFAR
jgi:hypothetical protein